DLSRTDDDAGLHFVRAGDLNAALEPVLDLARVVLEPAQRGDLALVDLHRVASDAEVRARGQLALGHHAAGDRADLRDREGLPHLRLADADLALDRREQ